MSSRHTIKWDFDVEGKGPAELAAQIEKIAKYMAEANEMLGIHKQHLDEGRRATKETAQMMYQYTQNIAKGAQQIEVLQNALRETEQVTKSIGRVELFDVEQLKKDIDDVNRKLIDLKKQRDVLDTRKERIEVRAEGRQYTKEEAKNLDEINRKRFLINESIAAMEKRQAGYNEQLRAGQKILADKSVLIERLGEGYANVILKGVKREQQEVDIIALIEKQSQYVEKTANAYAKAVAESAAGAGPLKGKLEVSERNLKVLLQIKNEIVEQAQAAQQAKAAQDSVSQTLREQSIIQDQIVAREEERNDLIAEYGDVTEAAVEYVKRMQEQVAKSSKPLVDQRQALAEIQTEYESIEGALFQAAKIQDHVTRGIYTQREANKQIFDILQLVKSAQQGIAEETKKRVGAVELTADKLREQSRIQDNLVAREEERNDVIARAASNYNKIIDHVNRLREQVEKSSKPLMDQEQALKQIEKEYGSIQGAQEQAYVIQKKASDGYFTQQEANKQILSILQLIKSAQQGVTTEVHKQAKALVEIATLEERVRQINEQRASLEQMIRENIKKGVQPTQEQLQTLEKWRREIMETNRQISQLQHRTDVIHGDTEEVVTAVQKQVGEERKINKEIETRRKLLAEAMRETEMPARLGVRVTPPRELGPPPVPEMGRPPIAFPKQWQIDFKAPMIDKARVAIRNFAKQSVEAQKATFGWVKDVRVIGPVLTKTWSVATEGIRRFTGALMTGAMGIGRLAREWKEVSRRFREDPPKWFRDLKTLDERLQRIRKRVSRVARAIRAWGRNFLWLGRDITVFTAMALGVATKLTTEWARFEEQVRVTQRVLSRRLDIPIEEVEFKAEDLITGADIMGEILAISDPLAISISAATMSFGHLVRAGYDTERALKVSEQAMVLNRGSMISLADATETMINVFKAYGDEVYSAADIADILTVADQNAAASLAELNAGMGYVYGTAARMGMSLEQSAAAMTLLTNAGFSGSVAGRELRSVMNNLMQQAQDYVPGIIDAEGNMVDFATALQLVEDRADSFGSEIEKTRFLQEVFGETNLSLVQTLMENRDELEKLTQEYENSSGAAAAAAKEQEATLEFQLDKLRVAAEKAQLAVGKGFGEAIHEGTGFLGSLTSAINDALPYVEQLAYSFGIGFVESVRTFVGIAQDAIFYATEFATAMGLIEQSAVTATGEVDAASNKMAFIGENLGAIAGFAIIAGPALMAIGMALEVLAPIVFVLSGAITILSTAFSVLTTVAGFVGAALGGVTIAAGPLILIIIAIIAVAIIFIGMLQALFENLHLVEQLFMDITPIMEGFQAVIGGIIAFLTPLAQLLMLIGKVIFLIDLIVIKVIVDFLNWLGVIQLIGHGLTVLGAVFQWLGDIIEWWIDKIEGVVSILEDIVDLLFGTSPGLIPGLQESTDAMKEFNTEASQMEDVNVELSRSLGITTGELEGMTAANMATWGEPGEMGMGMGGVVEIGPETKAFLRQLVTGEETGEWDWSALPAETVATGETKTYKKGYYVGGGGVPTK